MKIYYIMCYINSIYHTSYTMPATTKTPKTTSHLGKGVKIPLSIRDKFKLFTEKINNVRMPETYNPKDSFRSFETHVISTSIIKELKETTV